MIFITDFLYKAYTTINLCRLIVKAPPGKPPREGLFWYEPTHRWRKIPEYGGSHSEKEFQVYVKTELKNIYASIQRTIKRGSISNKRSERLLNNTLKILLDANTDGAVYDRALSRLNLATKLDSKAKPVRDRLQKLHTLVQEDHSKSDKDDMIDTAKPKNVKSPQKDAKPKPTPKPKNIEPPQKDVKPKPNKGNVISNNLDENIHKEFLSRMHPKLLDIGIVMQDIVPKTYASKAISSDIKSAVRQSVISLRNQLNSISKLTKEGDIVGIQEELSNVDTLFNDVRKHIPKRQKAIMRLLEDSNKIFHGFSNELEYRINSEQRGSSLPKFSAATNNLLEENANLKIALDDWSPQINYEGKQTDAYSEKISKDVVSVVANVKTQFQSRLQNAIEKTPTNVYDNEEWEKFAKESNYDPMQVRGLCSSRNGVHLSDDASHNLVAHEYGHFMDQRKIGKQAFTQLKKRYAELIKTGKGFVTDYAKTNPEEFAAEAFAHYITDPTHLNRVDPVSFDIVKNSLAQ